MKKQKGLGDPAVTPSDPSAVAIAPSAEVADQGLQAPIAPAHEADVPACEHCGQDAFILLRFPAVEAYLGTEEKWHPLCQSAYYEHLDNAEDTNRHETERFGGAYGLVTWEERPVRGRVSDQSGREAGPKDGAQRTHAERDGSTGTGTPQ